MNVVKIVMIALAAIAMGAFAGRIATWLNERRPPPKEGPKDDGS